MTAASASYDGMGTAAGSILHRLASAIIAVALLAACTVFEPPAGGEAAPHNPDPLRVETASIADDGRSVEVGFTGGKEFDLDDPCSVAYEASAEVNGDALMIGIFAKPHPGRLPEGWACDAMGYGRTVVIPLDEPFDGTTVRDLTGQVLFLGPPAGLAEITGLPEGWELRRAGNAGDGPTPLWSRVFSPVKDPWPANGDSLVELIQALGGPLGGDPANDLQAVEVNGTIAAYSFHRPTGHMELMWTLGPDELSLSGYRRDFSKEAFIDLAESIGAAD
jgi:hypothetical protein